jgi:general secretion pathway protein K
MAPHPAQLPLPSCRPARRKRDQGFALIVVMWFLVFLSGIAINITLIGREDVRIGRNVVAGAAAQSIADGGIAYAVYSLSDPVLSSRWDVVSKRHHMAVPGGRVAVSVADERGKINIKTVSKDLLIALFSCLTSDASLQSATAAALVERLHPPTQNSTEAKPVAQPEGIDDLIGLGGASDDLIVRAAPFLSFYSDSEGPDVASASSSVLCAMASLPTKPPAPVPAKSDGSVIIVELSSTGHSDLGADFTRIAVVRIDLTKPADYRVLYWGSADHLP